MFRCLSTLTKYQVRRLKIAAKKETVIDPSQRIKFTEDELLEMGKTDSAHDRTLKGIFKDKYMEMNQ